MNGAAHGRGPVGSCQKMRVGGRLIGKVLASKISPWPHFAKDSSAKSMPSVGFPVARLVGVTVVAHSDIERLRGGTLAG